jgi:hypothetical protein
VGLGGLDRPGPCSVRLWSACGALSRVGVGERGGGGGGGGVRVIRV